MMLGIIFAFPFCLRNPNIAQSSSRVLVQIHNVGKELNLSNLRDRIKLLQNMTIVFRLLDVMARDVPKLTGRLPVYEVLECHPGVQSSVFETPLSA
jgi:hypothetical protein